MIYAIVLFILFSFISYRLIGVRSSIPKRFISSIFSLVFTSAIFYVLYLRYVPLKDNIFQFDHYSFLYFINLVIVSLGFSLLLEMMDFSSDLPETSSTLSTFDKLRYFVSTRLRYANLLFIIFRNGLLRLPFQLTDEKREQQISIALKNTLEKAGGIFVKFGQFLSTRSDLFPQPFLKEMSTLQEKAQPVPVKEIKEIISEQLQDSIENLFLKFDEKPLASASIAQVHKARLHTGEDVIVKVLRPNLKKQFKIDVNILTNFAELLAERAIWAKKIGIISLTEGFITNLYEEVDFTVELKNLNQMKQLESEKVYIPRAFKKYSTSEVLVMECLDGYSINNINKIIKDQNKKEEIIDDIFKEMLVEIFEDGIFHGDPHPGNIFILKNEQPAFIDFGSVGKLSEIQRNGFKWLLLGITKKSSDSMINGIRNLVENKEEIDIPRLEQVLSQFLAEHTFEGDIMKEMGQDLFNMMSQFGLKFYPDVAGAFRSVITLQGSLQTINPDFNLNNVIDKQLKNSMKLSNLVENTLNEMETDLLNFVPKIREIPKRIDNISQQVEAGKFTFRMSLFSDKDNVKFVNSVLNLFFTGMVGFSLGLLALGALFLAQTEDPGGYSFLNVFGYSGLGLSVTMLIRVAIQSMNRKQ